MNNDRRRLVDDLRDELANLRALRNRVDRLREPIAESRQPSLTHYRQQAAKLLITAQRAVDEAATFLED